MAVAPEPFSSEMPLNLVSRLDVADLRRPARRPPCGWPPRSSELSVSFSLLDLQVADALQHRVHLGEGTLSGLDQRDAVLRVALSLGHAADLAAHLLRDGKAGSVVGRHG